MPLLWSPRVHSRRDLPQVRQVQVALIERAGIFAEASKAEVTPSTEPECSDDAHTFEPSFSATTGTGTFFPEVCGDPGHQG